MCVKLDSSYTAFFPMTNVVNFIPFLFRVTTRQSHENNQPKAWLSITCMRVSYYKKCPDLVASILVYLLWFSFLLNKVSCCFYLAILLYISFHGQWFAKVSYMQNGHQFVSFCKSIVFYSTYVKLNTGRKYMLHLYSKMSKFTITLSPVLALFTMYFLYSCYYMITDTRVKDIMMIYDKTFSPKVQY